MGLYGEDNSMLLEELRQIKFILVRLEDSAYSFSWILAIVRTLIIISGIKFIFFGG